MKKPLIATLLLIPILVVFAVFVWPTRYRYASVTVPTNALLLRDRYGIKTATYDLPVRVDRFTGRAEALLPDGWRGFIKTPK